MNKENCLPLGSLVNVQAYKYNGKLYRQWSRGKVIENNDNHLVLSLEKTKVTEKNNQKWITKEPTIWFFSKTNLFNALIYIKAQKPWIYVNLASTFIFEDKTIKYIDYDLDIKSYPGKDFNIIDKNDFITNAKMMSYPQELIDAINGELKKIVEMYYSDSYIFNSEYIQSFFKKTKI